MNYDGTGKKKITWINDSRGQALNSSIPNFYDPGAWSVGDNDWSHDGTQSVVYLINKDAGGSSQLGDTGSIWLLTLESSSFTASSASYLNYPQAPNSIIASFGADLANGSYRATLPLGTSLGGTAVNVEDSQGVTRPADLFFASAGQVNWLVPPKTAAGPAIVTTTSGDGTVSSDVVDIESTSPALFDVDASGSGPAAAYVLPSGQFTFTCAAAYNCTTTPVSVSGGGVYLILFGTGIENYSGAVTVNIAGQKGNALASVPAVYAGAQGGYAGLDQINVELPASLAGSGEVTVSVAANGTTSNSVQLQIQ
jgi:uncharacterized protein (TIGR03437 family)